MTTPLVLGPAPDRYDRADQDRVRQAATDSVMALLRQFGTRTATATLPFSATPTFDAANLSVFRLSLTANVTSSTLLNGADGQVLVFVIKQDPAVARTFVWPTNVKGAMVISAGLSTVSAQVFMFDAASNNAYALSPGVVGMQMAASLPSNFTTAQAMDTPQMLSNSTGLGLALLGANSPASIVSAPYTWVKVTVADGTICYVPVWK